MAVISRRDHTRRKTGTRHHAASDVQQRAEEGTIRNAGADERAEGGGWHGEKGGDLQIDKCGQHVLERTSVLIDDQGNVEARFTVGLPARGRTILGQRAREIVTVVLPRCVEEGLLSSNQDMGRLAAHVSCVETTQQLRDCLPSRNLVAFVGNGAILPRASGASDAPLPASQAVPFESPPSMAVELQLPDGKRVRGMGIPAGITLIVGGGFHGKSTLLKALEAGYTNKIPGDGRELVVSTPDAFKLRAEDGRRVEGVDISPFITNLPMDKNTRCFRTDDASGSTSQAANLMEALEVGSRLLLIDEDTTATNFMIRDARMQALVSPDKEPITPLLAKIRALAGSGVSVILVIGGSGAYFEVADCVLAMDCFRVREVTAQARDIAARAPEPSIRSHDSFGRVVPRTPTFIFPAADRLKTRAPDMYTISFGHERVDLRCVEQLFDQSQVRALTSFLELLITLVQRSGGQQQRCLDELLDHLEARMDAQDCYASMGGLDVTAASEMGSETLWMLLLLKVKTLSAGLDALTGSVKAGNLARPRKIEMAAALNRLRTLKVQQNPV